MEHLYVLDIVPRAMHRSPQIILTTTSSHEEYYYLHYTNKHLGRYKELAQGQSDTRELRLTKFFLRHYHPQYCPRHHMDLSFSTGSTVNPLGNFLFGQLFFFIAE